MSPNGAQIQREAHPLRAQQGPALPGSGAALLLFLLLAAAAAVPSSEAVMQDWATQVDWSKCTALQ